MADQRETIELEDEQGNRQEFDLVDVIEVDAQRYALLQQVGGGDTATVFRIRDSHTLEAVEDDEEIQRVAAALEDLGEYEAIEVDKDGLDDEDDEEFGLEDDDEDLDADEDLDDDLDDEDDLDADEDLDDDDLTEDELDLEEEDEENLDEE